MTDSLVLLEDLITDARTLGLRALDATAVLRAAQPGAFLDHDIHMTAKGHAALAEALATTIAAPLVPALQHPAPGLPEGRSFVPTADEWTLAGEVAVKGSSAAGCTTQILREWLRVHCQRHAFRDSFGAVEVREGEQPATMAMRTPDALSLVTPMTLGEPITARFHWKSRSRDLEIRWPEGSDGKPRFTGAFVDVAPPTAVPPPHPAAQSLCDLDKRLTNQVFCEQPGVLGDGPEMSDCVRSCGNLWGDPDLDVLCKAAHGDKGPARIACVQNDPLFAPTCPDGQVHAFASNACFPVCDGLHPCVTATCTQWQGSGVCL